MSDFNIRKVPTTEDRSLPIFAGLDRLADRIRLEAYNLFAPRLCWSEFRSDAAYRRVELPSSVDVGKTTADFNNGLLVVVAALAASSKSAPAKITIGQGS